MRSLSAKLAVMSFRKPSGSSSKPLTWERRPGAVNFTRSGHGTLNITIPANANIVPPSYYMLFAVNAKGVPSTGYWVKVP